MFQMIKRKMTHRTPKIDLILLKLRPIPPSTHGASFTIWHLCHWLSTGDATVWLPPCARINSQAQRWGMKERNWARSVFVLSISEFKWILRFKIQVCSFYHLQPPQDDDFELFVFVPKMFVSGCYVARYGTKCNMTTKQLEKSCLRR